MDLQAAYEETLSFLYERLPMFSRIGKAALKPDLNNIKKFCKALDNPHKKFKSIHIAGTNGKGSTSHALSVVLQQAGYKTGLYTSPHLVDFRERISVNSEEIPKDWVVNFVASYKNLIEEIQPSFFEITVAMAFLYFQEQAVDIAIIETGLGGRLDSTNIITPILSIITNINYDHTDLLGNTLKEIAFEKAGIIKENVPVVVGEQHPETESVFFETAIHKHTTVYYADTLWDLVRVKQDANYQYFKAVHKAHREMYDLQTDLLGSYQQHNIKTVLAATEILIANQDLKLSIEQAIGALYKAKKQSRLRGRWDKLSEQPFIVTDVAHNPSGMKEVLAQWQDTKAANKHVLIGFVKDKDIRETLALFPKDTNFHFCNADIERALPVNELYDIARDMGFGGSLYHSVSYAMNYISERLNEDDALLITGSFFVVGEAMEHFEKKGKEEVVRERETN